MVRYLVGSKISCNIAAQNKYYEQDQRIYS